MSVGASRGDNLRKRIFTLKLDVSLMIDQPLRFTIKFRQDSTASWKWASEQSVVADGEIIFYHRNEAPSAHLEDYIDCLNADFKVSPIGAETPNTQLWLLEASSPPANGDDSGFTSKALGIPSNFKRWFALGRLWAPWIVPLQGKDDFKVDKDCLVCSFLRADGQHLVLLGYSGAGSDLTIFRSDNGNVVVNSRNDKENQGHCQVLAAVAPSFELANAAVMYQARKMVMSYTKSSPIRRDEDSLRWKDPITGKPQRAADKDIMPTWYEEWADGFTYCTWNGLGQALTEDKIFEALESLEKNDINITNLIIDDNWQSLDNAGQDQTSRGMTRFEANEEGFPNGLRATASEIRRRHLSIQHIAVWHAMLGYWGAISPTGQLAQDYGTVQAKKPGGSYWTCIDPDDVNRFYNDFYQFLASCGVDGVKTDAQFMLDDLQSAKDRRAMITAYQDAWTIAHLRHLGARAISCMSQAPPIIFHEQMRTSNPQIFVRNSDDFFPDIESSHPWHVFANAHNALLTQHLNVLPDWDMFQTDHPWAYFHGAARCVSGGPVYITDTPGKHDPKLIKEMTARTIRGNTVILRPQRVAKSSDPYREYTEGRLLKIDTFTGSKDKGSSIVGVFNVAPKEVEEIVTLKDFPGTEEGCYVVRSHVSESLCEPCTQEDSTSICVSLDVKGYDILSAYPVQSFEVSSGEIQVANLGLLGKMTGAAAIVNTDVYVENAGRIRVWTALKALGTLGECLSLSSLRLVHWILTVMKAFTSPDYVIALLKMTSLVCSSARAYLYIVSRRVTKPTMCSKLILRGRGTSPIRTRVGAMR